jgi:hypothetical protein
VTLMPPEQELQQLWQFLLLHLAQEMRIGCG